MSLKLINGDYAKDKNGKLIKVEYIDELLQDAMLLLTAGRGRFYPNKDFGSYIKCISKEPFEEYALAYARQALLKINGVSVKSAKKQNEGITFDLIINGEERQVTVQIESKL